MNVSVFGDSHARMLLSEDCKNAVYQSPDKFFQFDHGGVGFRVMKCGGTGATAYGLTNPQSETGAGGTIKGNLAGADVVVLMFGEVDARAHISVAGDVLAAAAGAVERYEEFLTKSVLPAVGRVIVCGCLPHSMVWHKRQGSLALAELALDSGLLSMCRRMGAQFVSLRSICAEPSGVVADDTLEDDSTYCHIKPEFVRERLRDALVEAVKLI